jgi:predicted ATPase
MTGPIRWLERARITNYRSISQVEVAFSPLTILIGPNGSGKSNLLDALSFLADAVATTPYQALDRRGGLGEVLRRVPDQQRSFSIDVDVVCPWTPAPEGWARGTYGFEIARSERRGQRPLEVVRESCSLTWQGRTESFEVRRGIVSHPGNPLHQSRLEADRLYLPTASALPNLAPLFGQLRSMVLYTLDVPTLRQPQPEAEGVALGSRGEHLPDVLGQLAVEDPAAKQRLDEYLAAIVPGFLGIDRGFAGGYVTLEGRQRFGSAEAVFGGDALSEGTVRAAGVLAALFQLWVRDRLISLVALEEPELALHPAAAGVLFDALTEASSRVQVVATSQSADLLDRDDIDPDQVRAVVNREGLTEIGELDPISLRMLDDRRLTLGELMRANQISPRQVARAG